MSKLFFGNNTATPVLDVKTNYVSGLGIDEYAFAAGTIAVNDRVLRNNVTEYQRLGSVISNYAQGWDSTYGGITSYGYGTITYGERSSSYGQNANALGKESTAIGAKTSAQGEGSVVVGTWATATSYGVSIGGLANYGNSGKKEGQIVIGYKAKGGIAPGSIVIGKNSVATTYNDTYNTIVIGNDHNASAAFGSVIIGGYDYTNGTQIAHEKSFSNDSVVIGLNAGGVLNGTDTACSIAIGSNATINHQHTMAIGYGAQATGWGALALGYTANSTSTRKNISEYANIAIGYQSDSQGDSNISMGFQAKNKGIGNIAIGWKSIAGTNVPGITSCNYSIAIGYAAYAVAQDSVQIGTGDNDEPMTIKYRDKKLLNADGTIPYQRFSNYTPINGQVLYYDSSLGELAWKDVGQGGGGGGSYTLPVASRNTLGGVKVGNGLNVTLDGTLSVANQNTTWGSITGKLNNQADLKSALDSKQKVLQYEEMPTPKASLEGQVIQYIGEETVSYNPGQFYQCVEDNNPTATITSDTQWANLEVDANTFANYIAKYYYSNDLDSVPSKIYEIEYVNQFDGEGWLLVENETAVYVKDIYKMGITAEGATPTLGDKVYVHLYMHAATGWIWKKLLIDAQVSVNNTLVSTSTKQALSANMGRVLNDKVEQLAGISHFLAMWDTDFGIARYLNAGYQYESGDYFIVATISPDRAELTVDTEHYYGGAKYEPYAPDQETTPGEQFKHFVVNIEGDESPATGYYHIEITEVDGNDIYGSCQEYSNAQENIHEYGIQLLAGTPEVGDVVEFRYRTDEVNFMPDGSMYPGDTAASRIETDDPVQISDMYFYDGSHWIFLPSSSRQIAVDEDLDNTSRNPVENRVVTNALNQKLQKYGDENSVYVNDIDGEPVMVSLGSGLGFDWDNYQLVNTRTGGVWGQITGNIESQTDLVDYVASHGGGSSSSIQLSDVFVRNQNVRKDYINEWEEIRYKGYFSDVFFKMNTNYASLLASKDDVYVTISRYNDSNGARNRHKMTVMNDCNRFKTNKKYYCWRSTASSSTWDYNSDYEEWMWNYGQPKETEYYYFYTEEDYDDDPYAMQSADPTIFISSVYTGNIKETFQKGNWAHSFNDLRAYGLLSDFDDPNYERCERYDIDEVISLNSNFSGSHRSSEYQYGNVVKNNFTRMDCYIANTPTGKAYLWCDDWTASGESIYAYLDENDNPLYEVPKFMGDLQYYGEYGDVDITLVEHRPDLNYYHYWESASEFRDVVEMLRLSTQDFPDEEDSVAGIYTNWNSYCFDYPIKPVRLADCKIYVYKVPFAENDTSLAQRYAELVGHAYTFDEVEADSDLKHMVQNQDDLIFVLPYDTSYLWLRLLGWQKSVYYRRGDDNIEVYCEPWERHDFRRAIEKASDRWLNSNILGRSFGYKSQCTLQVGGTCGRYFRKLQFNTITGSELAQNRKSKMTPITRALWVNGQGTTGLCEE